MSVKNSKYQKYNRKTSEIRNLRTKIDALDKIFEIKDLSINNYK